MRKQFDRRQFKKVVRNIKNLNNITFFNVVDIVATGFLSLQLDIMEIYAQHYKGKVILCEYVECELLEKLRGRLLPYILEELTDNERKNYDRYGRINKLERA